MKIIKVKKIKCRQCGHVWTPRKKIVRICPNLRCHSYLFDVPKTKRKLISDKNVKNP